MPGRISYNGIFIDFQNEWVKFDDPINSIVSSKQTRSGIVEINKFFDQQIITATMRLSPGQDEIQVRRFFEYANDGSTFELWRDPNLGTYISFEGGGNSATVPTITPRGLQTNDKVAGTFTNTAVADAAWFLDPSTGLMTVVPTTNHIPRFEAGKYGQHAIRIDGAAANLIDKPSGPFDADNWAVSNVTATANTTETLDPSGANTADKLLTTSSSGTITYTSGTAVGNDVAHGIWLKCNSATVAGFIDIRGTTGGNSPEAITMTTEWQRFSMTQDTSTIYTGDIQGRITITPNAAVVYAWSGNLYDSAKFDLGTVGALSTSAVTRGADKLTFASANIINQDKGTIAMWFKPDWGPSNLGTNFALFQSGASETNRHVSIVQLSDNTLQCRMYRDNGSNVAASMVPSTAAIVQGQFNHLVLTYDATISNSLNVYLAGALMTGGTSSNNPFNPSDVSTPFTIGSLFAATNPAFCTFDEIIITQDVKSAAWVQQIFSRTQAVGEGRNYWASVRLANLNYVRQALRGNRSTIPLEFEEVLS